MIMGVPAPTDFYQAGLNYLCLAWIDLTGLLLQSESHLELQSNVDDPHTDLVKEYWHHESQRLATCGTLIHHGSEFLLKSRIAQVSPYLLLESPTAWPTNAAQSDKDFSEFKTLDSQFLPRVHDTVYQTRLPENFKQQLEKIRRRRNAVTHGFSSHFHLSAEELLKDILEVATTILGEAVWPGIRNEYGYNVPGSWADYHGAITASLMREWQCVISFLKPQECKRHLGFDKKQRRFICADCHSIDLRPDPPIKLALLRPNTSNSRTLFCIVCGNDLKILRAQCKLCPGNILSQDRQCLSCGSYIE